MNLNPKLSFPKNSIVDNDIKKLISAKRTYRYTSAICESLKLAETIGIPKLSKPYSLQHPPWLYNKQYCDISLSKPRKEIPPDDSYNSI